uniref:Tubulin/FtsZ GTPase domain-containing protein n=1 Tax=Gopherus agassizii TaxID=38772 RepID=A0A452GNU6_9SAUR
MSIVTVQLGQCGNQIGYEVFNAICNDFHSTHGLCSKKENESYQEACKERFFSEEKTGGTIFKDFFFSYHTEPVRNIQTCFCSFQISVYYTR